MIDIVERLDEPEAHYPGNFDTPKRANAMLSCLCQEAIEEIESLRQKLAASQAREQQLREALMELVSCKNLKSEIEAIRFAGPSGYNGERWKQVALEKEREYIKRKPDAWIAACEALATPSDTTALSAIVAKAGEVMRERCLNDIWYMPIPQENAIRAIPGVTMDDLKGGAS